jgi:hypothetical protein
MFLNKIKFKRNCFVIIAFIFAPSVLFFIRNFGLDWTKLFYGEGSGYAIIILSYIFLFLYTVLIGYFIKGFKNKFLIYVSALVLIIFLNRWINGKSFWNSFHNDFGFTIFILLIGTTGILIGIGLKKLINSINNKINSPVKIKQNNNFYANFFSFTIIVIFLSLIFLVLFDHSSAERFANSCVRTKSSQCFKHAALHYPLEMPEDLNPIIYENRYNKVLRKLLDVRVYALVQAERNQEARAICIEEFQFYCNSRCYPHSPPCSLAQFENIITSLCKKAEEQGVSCEKEKQEILACTNYQDIPEEKFQQCLQKSKEAYFSLKAEVRRGY